MEMDDGSRYYVLWWQVCCFWMIFALAWNHSARWRCSFFFFCIPTSFLHQSASFSGAPAASYLWSYVRVQTSQSWIVDVVSSNWQVGFGFWVQSDETCTANQILKFQVKLGHKHTITKSIQSSVRHKIINLSRYCSISIALNLLSKHDTSEGKILSLHHLI